MDNFSKIYHLSFVLFAALWLVFPKISSLLIIWICLLTIYEQKELVELLLCHPKNPSKHDIRSSNDINITSNYKNNCLNLFKVLENVTP